MFEFFVFIAVVCLILKASSASTPTKKPPRRRSGPAPGSVEITFHKPPTPKVPAYKPKPDRYTVYAAADACLANAEALERKAVTESDEIKRTRLQAQAAAQRLKAEKIALQAG